MHACMHINAIGDNPSAGNENKTVYSQTKTANYFNSFHYLKIITDLTFSNSLTLSLTSATENGSMLSTPLPKEQEAT